MTPQNPRFSFRALATCCWLFLSSSILLVLGDSPLPILPTAARSKVATRVLGFASSKHSTVFESAKSAEEIDSSSSVTEQQQSIDSGRLYAQSSASNGLLCFQINGTVLQVSSAPDDSTKKGWECTTFSSVSNSNFSGTRNNSKTTAQEEEEEIMPQKISPTGWVPLEGLFGVYTIPSGTIWVLITGSEQVYEAPAVVNCNNNHHPANWFQIRRVTDLELVHIPSRLLPVPHLKEEVRQVQLLRKALKQHTFYYIPRKNHSSSNDNGRLPIIPDMTKNLQRSFQRFLPRNSSTSEAGQEALEGSTSKTIEPPESDPDGSPGQPQEKKRTKGGNKWWWETFVSDEEGSSQEEPEEIDENSSSTTEQGGDETGTSTSVAIDVDGTNNTSNCDKGWWEDPMNTKNAADKPDSRFFWNEAAVQPLVERYNSEKKSAANDTVGKHADDKPAVDGNKVLLENIIPLTSAFVGVQQRVGVLAGLNDDDDDEVGLVYDELLISRRSRFRAGTRFTKRGADATGAVANYAESEQICLISSSQNDNSRKGRKKKGRRLLEHIFSHIQTRGSIPLRWSSPTDIKTYRPRVRIGTDPIAQTRALLAHVMEQLSLYSTKENDDIAEATKNSTTALLVFVNLIDKKSDQGRLGRTFDAVLNAVVEVYAPQNVSSSSSNETQAVTLEPNTMCHVWYDFHAEVKNGRWDRLAKLLKKTKPALLDHGYFSAKPPTIENLAWTIESKQDGVVRTNCMDCLDRTNVVQSLFGRAILFHQLQQLSSKYHNETKKGTQKRLPAAFVTAFKESQSLTLPWENGEVSHRLLWADNADAISRLYAGTPALKGDFTRTGKRTRKGALDDGMNSLQRYYLNNFLDADRQEGTDLMVGYSSFSNLECDNDKDEAGSDESDGADSSGMTLQEAARQILLGNNAFNSRDDDEKKHERIKESYKHHSYLRQSLDRVSGGASPNVSVRRPHITKPGASPLGLRWLPGDLQDLVRSRAMLSTLDDRGVGLNADYSSLAALTAIDRRAAVADPWWVVPESTDDEAAIDNEADKALSYQELKSEPGTRTIHAGYVLSAVLLSTSAPLSMASLVVLLMCALYIANPPDE